MKNLLILLSLSLLFACGEKVSMSPYNGTWNLSTVGANTDVGTAKFTKDSMYITQYQSLIPCGFSKDKENITINTPTIGVLYFTETSKTNSEIVWAGKNNNPFLKWVLSK